jgi:hypothetical protein
MQVGLLYENAVRKAEEYRDIQRQLSKRRWPRYLLIAMPDRASAGWLRRELRAKQSFLVITTVRELEDQLFSALVYRVGVQKPSTLDAFLRDHRGQLDLPFGPALATL